MKIRGLGLGADDYITKPFSVKLLLVRCNSLVNNHLQMQEKYHVMQQGKLKKLMVNTDDQRFLDRVMRVIDRYIDDVEFNMNVFATEVGVSRSGLFAKLRAISGQSPANFVLNIRLQRAADALEKNLELSITEVSDQFGFSSPKYFRRCFKEKYGITPLDFRNGKEVVSEEDTDD